MKKTKKYLLSLELQKAIENHLNLSMLLVDKINISMEYYDIHRKYLSYDKYFDFNKLSSIAYCPLCGTEYKKATYKDIHYYITFINGCIEATKKALKQNNLEL